MDLSLGIAAVWLAAVTSLFVVVRFERHLLARGIPSLGLVVVLMYTFTYGIGLTLWRLDPSSLFGYGTLSTIGSLERLAYLFAIGLLSVTCGYLLTRYIQSSAKATRTQECFTALAHNHFFILRRLTFCLVFLCVVGLLCMTSAGLFIRDPLQQQQVLETSLFAKLLIGTSLMSRLAPVALLLIPLVAPSWTTLQRLCVTGALCVWLVLVIASSSRGQLLALPLYLLVGSLIWRRLRLKHAFILLLIGATLFLPVAELIRVQRYSGASNPELHKKYEIFQIGKQLMGTSHEFYLLLQPQDCIVDLKRQLYKDPQAARLLGVPSSTLAPLPGERWNVVRLYESCSLRPPSIRGFSGLKSLPLGLIPNSLFPSAPSLFDGQFLVESLSENLGLHPGEISLGTISIFADSWWRWRWLGVFISCLMLGISLGLIQNLLLRMLWTKSLAGILGQLLVLSLIGTWINNSILTMSWHLFWDLPKALLELVLLASLLRYLPPREAS